MAVEIERKFLVVGTPWRGAAGEELVQGYLASQDGVVVRVRVGDGRAWLTVKGPARGSGLTRTEHELDLPVGQARELLELCGTRVLAKTRYRLPVGAHTWEVDVFAGLNAGLVVAEIELGSEEEAFERPPWLGEEVSDDARYLNARLVHAPFSTWVTP